MQSAFWCFYLRLDLHFFCCCSCTFSISFPFASLMRKFCNFSLFFLFLYLCPLLPVPIETSFSLKNNSFDHYLVFHGQFLCSLVNYQGYSIYQCISNFFWFTLVVCLLKDYLYLWCSPPGPVLDLLLFLRLLLPHSHFDNMFCTLYSFLVY